MPEGQTIKIALHELAHSVTHDVDAEELPDRSMHGAQAESVAHAVSAASGTRMGCRRRRDARRVKSPAGDVNVTCGGSSRHVRARGCGLVPSR